MKRSLDQQTKNLNDEVGCPPPTPPVCDSGAEFHVTPAECAFEVDGAVVKGQAGEAAPVGERGGAPAGLHGWRLAVLHAAVRHVAVTRAGGGWWGERVWPLCACAFTSGCVQKPQAFEGYHPPISWQYGVGHELMPPPPPPAPPGYYGPYPYDAGVGYAYPPPVYPPLPPAMYRPYPAATASHHYRPRRYHAAATPMSAVAPSPPARSRYHPSIGGVGGPASPGRHVEVTGGALAKFFTEKLRDWESRQGETSSAFRRHASYVPVGLRLPSLPTLTLTPI